MLRMCEARQHVRGCMWVVMVCAIYVHVCGLRSYVRISLRGALYVRNMCAKTCGAIRGWALSFVAISFCQGNLVES